MSASSIPLNQVPLLFTLDPVVNASSNHSSSENSVISTSSSNTEEDLEQQSVQLQQEELQSTSSIIVTSFNLLNNLVGAGMLSVPYTLKLVGIYQGLAALFLTSLAAWFSMILIGISCSVSGATSFDQLAQVAGIPFIVSRGILLLYTLGSLISFVVLSIDFVAAQGGLSETCGRFCEGWLDERFVVAAILFCVVLYPSSKYTSLASLKIVSIVSIVFMFGMIMLACNLYWVQRDEARIEPILPSQNSYGIWLVLPIYLVCFSAHYNGPRLYCELQNKTPKRFAIASGIAIFTAFCIYSSFGIISFITFPNARTDVLTNYSAHSYTAIVARLFMLVVILTTYPLAFHALRNCFVVLFRVDMPLLLLVFSSVPGALLPDIGVVLEFKGALFGGIVVYGVGCLAFLQTSKQIENEKHEGQGRLYKCLTVLAYLLLGWTAIATLGSLIVTILKLAGTVVM